MRLNPERQHRRSIRLPAYDYAQVGAYFVTVVTFRHLCLFGDIINREMLLNEAGQILKEKWFRTPEVRDMVCLYEDECIIMPNHLHAILWIIENDGPSVRVGATRRVAPTKPRGPQPNSVGAIIGQFKSLTTKQINILRGTPGAPVWQRNYYEHVIRDEADLARVREYIVGNAMRWGEDRKNLKA